MTKLIIKTYPLLGAVFCSVLCSFSFNACGPSGMGESEPEISSLHSDSGITGKRYAQIATDLKSLETSYPDMVKVIHYGKTLRNKDLILLKISDPKVQSSEVKPAVFISGSTHGNEYLHIADQLPELFLKDQLNARGFRKFLDKGGVLYILPILNPDGYEARTRENANRADLNRDFELKRANKSGFRQPETRALTEFLDKDLAESNLKMKLTMDYHCCIGGLIYPWGYESKEPVPEKDLKVFRSVGATVESIFGYRHGTAMEIVNYNALGASDDYYYEHFVGNYAFTFEGAYGREQRNIQKHQRMWDELFNFVASSAQNPTGTSGSGELSRDIFLAVEKEPEAGKLTLASAANTNITSVVLCLATLKQCNASDPNAYSFSLVATRDGRNFFRSNAAVLVKDSVDGFLLGKDQTGAVKESRAVRFQKRQRLTIR